MKIEIYSEIHLDALRERICDELTTKQLVDFVMDIGDNLTDSEGYYKLLKKELNKIDIEE